MVTGHDDPHSASQWLMVAFVALLFRLSPDSKRAIIILFGIACDWAIRDIPLESMPRAFTIVSQRRTHI
jgi:hypothetical protein